MLVRPDSLLRDKVAHSLNQADLIVETTRAHNRRRDALSSVTDSVSEARVFLGVPILQLFLEADGVDEALRWVLKNDELVRNDTIDNFLLL